MSLDEKDIELLTKVIQATVDKSINALLNKPLPPVETVVAVEPKKRGRPPKTKVDKPEKSATIASSRPTRIVRLTTKVVDDSDNVRTPPRRGSGQGQQARVESFQPIKNRPNLFVDPKSWVAKAVNQYEKSGGLKDKKIDKKLVGDNEPTQRREEVIMASVDCSMCGKECIVNIDTIMPDDETGEVRYICDNCIRR